MYHPPAFFSRPSSSSFALRVSELCCCYSLIPFVESTAVMKLKSPLANSPAPTLFLEFILYTAAQCFCSKPSSGHTCDTAPPRSCVAGVLVIHPALSPASLRFVHSALATVATSIFHRNAPASGPLHQLPPPPETV